MEDKTSYDEEIKYFKMALALSGIAVNTVTAEIIVDTWNKIVRKKGQFNVEDAVSIEFSVLKRHQRVEAMSQPPTTNTK